MKPYQSVDNLLRPVLRVRMPWLKGVRYLLSGHYREAETFLSPEGLFDGDRTIKKAVVIRRLSDPRSQLRRQLEQSLTETIKTMCREVGTAFVTPGAFIELTQGQYAVHIQQENLGRNLFLISAHSSATVEGAECTTMLFPHTFEKRNSRIYLMDYFRF